MSDYDSAAFSVESRLTAATVPAWLVGKPTNQWIQIPGTSMFEMDLSKLITAGLSLANAGQVTPSMGNPTAFSALLYFGGALRTTGSEFMVFGGGGAGGWAGNDVRYLRLEDDAPRWRVKNTPSPTSQIWNNAVAAAYYGVPQDATHAYMRDGVSPNARHAYNQPQFINSTDKFMAFGCDNTWERDSGIFQNVDSMPWSTGVWDAPGTNLNVPQASTTNARWQVRHPTTDKVYCSTDNKVWQWDPADGSWTQVYSQVATDLARRGACIDPVNNICLTFGQSGGLQDKIVPFDISTPTAWTAISGASFSGPFASSIHQQTLYWAGGFVYDAQLGCFLFYQDDGFMYTITRVSNTDWYVDRLPMTGAAPDANMVSYAGNVAIWSKMQYVPNLKGVVLLLPGQNETFNGAIVSRVPTYFIKTA